MPEITHSPPGWYCFQALPRKEHIAARLLRQESALGAFCPRITYHKNTRRGKVRFIECLFPGYLFVHADLRQHYRFIRATRGIKDIVSFGERVPCISPAFLDDLRSRITEKEDMITVPDPILKAGMEVIIIEGPLRELNAVVSGDLEGHERVSLLLELLGRQMLVRIPREDLLSKESQPGYELWD